VACAGNGSTGETTGQTSSGQTSSGGTDSSGSTTTPADNSGSGDSATTGVEAVTLTVWGAEEDQQMLRSMIDEFIVANADKVNLTVNLGVQSESSAKDVILTDIEAAADVFAFANDQIADLYRAGALQEIVLNTDAVKAANNSSAVEAATMDGKLYAYPMTADNGYFMFYDAAYFSADDVKSLDKMMEVAAAAGKKITMQFDSGWYNYSFFKGAGFDVGLMDDGKTNYCNWNDAGGAAVVQAMLDIAANPGFVSLGDAEFVTGIKDGSIIAGINGTWNAGAAAEAWGGNYAAAKLPTYTLNGSQVQMSSFSGYRLIGVNAFCQNTGWAMLLGEWITNYDNQIRRFEERQQGPSKLSLLVMGARYLRRKQYIKSLLVTLFQVVIIVFIITFAIPYISKFPSLGTVKFASVFNPDTMKNEINDFDHSFKILLYSLMSFIVIIVAAFFWLRNIRDVRAVELKARGGEALPSFLEELATLRDERFHGADRQRNDDGLLRRKRLAAHLPLAGGGGAGRPRNRCGSGEGHPNRHPSDQPRKPKFQPNRQAP
jgi:arabinogalactan oligomer/maltooligosaccharide transport system substrate-binding protein